MSDIPPRFKAPLPRPSMTPLPVDSRLPEILETIGRHRSLVLVAEPGAGKTTRVPPALLVSGMLAPEHPAVVVLQPRRVAARSAATRMAEDRGWTLGEQVGYHVRFERKIGPRTRLQVITEGILTRRLLANPALEGVGAVVLDEFHERSLQTDLAVALLREVRQALRDDLILVVMSATLDAEPVARFLDAPIVEVEGRTFPVEVSYRASDGSTLPDRVGSAVSEVLSQSAEHDPGDILVFLPGAEEIRRSGRAIEPLADRERLLVLPLHGGLSSSEQDRALKPADRRKVILATNVAETSLTIDGVRTVIDSGLARFASHDPARGLDRLELARISRASAEQRAGRAGRTAPGRCIRLWAERESRGMPAFETPEIRRVDLGSTVLALHAWGVADPRRFDWFESPPTEAIDAAESLLEQLEALEQGRGRLTAVGRDLLSLPIHPRLGRLLLAAAEGGALAEASAAAAILSEKDFLIRSGPTDRDRSPRSHARSDILDRLDLLAEAERAGFRKGRIDPRIDPRAARNVARMRDDLRRISRRFADPSDSAEPDPETVVLRALLRSYPDRVVRRRAPGDPSGRMVGGRGVRLDRESVVRDADLFLALDAREDRRPGSGALELRARLASAIEPGWLEELFPDSVRREEVVRFDEETGRVVGVSTWTYRDLVLREAPTGSVDPDRASSVLADALGRRARSIVRHDEAAAVWLDRVEGLRQWMPEANWPSFDDDALAQVLTYACMGKRSEEEVRRVRLVPLLQGMLSPDQLRLLDEAAPEAIEVPSGSRIRLRYEPGSPPVLAVRLQELFGWTDTPRIARGRVPVLLHLLGPNFRPVQITDDLRSFWSSTYNQVRKDLRARYPKHAWPEDPWTATPEAKGGRRR